MMTQKCIRTALRAIWMATLSVGLCASSFAGVVKFKNATSQSIYLAIAYYESGRWVTEGWYELMPWALETVLSNNTNQYVYWYAELKYSDNNYESEGGEATFCVDPRNAFTKYYADRSCSGTKANFNLLDVGNYDIMTYTINYVSRCKGNCENGYGTYSYSDGGKCSGYWKNGKQHGQASCSYKSGAKYVGHWKHGDKHGYGTHYYSGGDKYVGYWKYGKMSGIGTYYWSSGGTWNGEFKKDNFWGYGVRTYTDGSQKKGIWVNDTWKYHCNLRVILVMNTQNSSVGPNATRIKANLLEFYREVAKVGQMKIQVKIFAGSDFSYNKIKNYLDNFTCQENDVVVFHYFGHGGRLESTTSRWPLMKLANFGTLSSVGLSLNYVKQKLYSNSKARLGLFFADCCNTTGYGSGNCIPKGNGFLSEPSFSRYGVETLFVDQQGYLLASSSSKGEVSLTENGGSSFWYVAFDDAMQTNLSKSSPSWTTIMAEVKSEVYNTTKDCEYSRTIQTPQFYISW